VRDRADQFDSEAAIGWRDDDLVDEAAQDVQRLGMCARISPAGALPKTIASSPTQISQPAAICRASTFRSAGS
jgi:hypothetical protein